MIIAGEMIKLTIWRTILEDKKMQLGADDNFQLEAFYSTRKSSTSKVRVELGGMMPGWPRAP